MKTIYVERVSSRPFYKGRGTINYQKHNAIHREGVTCKNCTRYPCFAGIDNMFSNLAETCHRFKKK